MVLGGGDAVRNVAPVERGVEDRATAFAYVKELTEAFDREGHPQSPSDVAPESLLAGE